MYRPTCALRSAPLHLYSRVSLSSPKGHNQGECDAKVQPRAHCTVEREQTQIVQEVVGTGTHPATLEHLPICALRRGANTPLGIGH